jgi:UDP-glucuronate decarboxylase
MMVRHLVTGGAGFIGSHLCDRLLERGDEVICFDNLFTSRRQNIEHLEKNPHFEFVRGDVCYPFHFEVDFVWSLACPASPKYYQQNPTRTIKTGVLGTIHALELAREVGARFLLTSTSEVYGDPLVHPQPEEYWGNVNLTGIRSCYDEAKRCGETLASTYARQYGVDIRIARLFNTYGPRLAASDGRVVSNFIVQALAGEPLTVYGDGTQTRSFCYVDDTVNGLLALMSNETVGANPVNLGNPVETRMWDLADAVLRTVGGPVGAILHMPLPQDDPVRRRPDITRARSILGWEPTTPLAEGLARTVAYFRNLQNR